MTFALKDALDHYKKHAKDLIKCPNKSRRVETVCGDLYDNGFYGFYLKKRGKGIETEYDGKSFLFECISSNGIVYFWVYFVGSPNEAKRYSVTLEFYGAKTTQIFKGQVVPIEEFWHDFVRTGKCFSISKHAFFAQFVNKDRQFEYSIEIKNLKRKLKDENCECNKK